MMLALDPYPWVLPLVPIRLDKLPDQLPMPVTNMVVGKLLGLGSLGLDHDPELDH